MVADCSGPFRRIQNANAADGLARREFGLCGPFAVYDRAEMMTASPNRNHRSGTLHEQSFDPLALEGGCRAHAGRLRRSARSFCRGLRSACSLRIHPSSAGSRAYVNLAEVEGCVSYVTLV